MPPEEDFWEIYNVAEGEGKTLLLAFLHTAARRKEMLNLQWDDLDLSNGKIRLWTRNRTAGSLGYDWIPLTQQLAKDSAEHAKSKCGEYVFCKKDGTSYAERQRLIPRLCAKAGVKKFTYHSIRHLTASILAKRRKDMPTIQAILRHQNVMITTRYVHRMGIVANALEDVFGK